MDRSVVTAKGQVVIPSKLRRKFGIKKGTQVYLYEREGEIVIKPITDDSCGITEDTVGRSKGDIGENITTKLSQFEGVYKNLLKAAIREIKISKFV